MTPADVFTILALLSILLPAVALTLNDDYDDFE